MISEPALSCPSEPALLRRVETELTAESSAATAERSCVGAAGTRPAAAFEDVRVIHVGAVDEIAASGYDLVERTMCRSDFLRARGDDHRLGHDMLPRAIPPAGPGGPGGPCGPGASCGPLGP